MIPTYKLLVTGDTGTGKSTFINRHLTGYFERSYIPTVGISTNQLKFHTNKGPIIFNVYDCSGSDEHKELREKCYVDADAVLIFFDVTSKLSYKNVSKWYQDTNKNYKYTVICGTKVDIQQNRMKPGHINFHRKKSLKYYEISAKSNYHFDKPFLAVARKFFGMDTNFTCAPNIYEPVNKNR
uniref:Ras family GTPase n=1 Tax=Pithovirus LCPAC001 TaxID=2506585 RepID=A0A481Z4M1_9VIRU|nr:MAG: Ras family GTPase [Pithovirus LCPAC001]